MSEQQAPDHKSGFRYRRALGESLVRETRAFEAENGSEAPLSRVRVELLNRQGSVLAELTLVEAMHAVQYNEFYIDGIDAREAVACSVFVHI